MYIVSEESAACTFAVKTERTVTFIFMLVCGVANVPTLADSILSNQESQAAMLPDFKRLFLENRENDSTEASEGL